MIRIQIVHGPNLNLLGERETAVYGNVTLGEINARLSAQAEAAGVALAIMQSNHEGELVDAIQAARTESGGLLINPAAYTHTSVAIRDALAAYPHPKVEVHLSNVHGRESFRRVSLVSPVVDAVLCGLGPDGYRVGLDYLLLRLKA